MSILVVFYSRSGTTAKVARELASRLGAETEEIKEEKNRKGLKGYLQSAWEAGRKTKPSLKSLEKDPARYDLIVVGTPVWVGTMASPVRSYLDNNKDKFDRLAFFTTQGSAQTQRVVKDLEAVSQRAPVALMEFTTKEVSKGGFQEKLGRFINKLT
ncbi:MAG TPA: NAD(P)H-dependent oxidoreductase [Patescibacteria group bacterium]|nr:NAD(P)H-dependent oxidoreductase [Patescibacteria group bacterium]